MYVSPRKIFLSSSFTSSKPGGTITSTTYLPGGNIGLPSSGFSLVLQMEQFVPLGRPDTGSTAVTLGNRYIPSYGAGCIWLSIDQPSLHFNCELFGSVF